MVRLDPDRHVAAGVIRPHRDQLGVHAAEIEIVVLGEGDVRLAVVGVLEQLRIDRPARREHLGELQAEFVDVLLLRPRANDRRPCPGPS